MSNLYRVPKELRELAKIPESITLEEVVQIRNQWGSEWATNIIDKVLRDATVVYKENRMADQNATSDLNEEMTELFADVFSFYLRAHGAHWNVMGTDFAEYHKLFNDIYDDVYGSVDPLAENLRKLGLKAPFQLPQLISIRTLSDATTPSSDARVLANDLLEANDVVIGGIVEAIDSASEVNQQGIVNFLADRLDKHQFWKWQLSASLGMETPQADLTEEPAEEIGEPTEEPADFDAAIMPMMISYSEEIDEASVEERASAARIGEGSFVSWNTSNGRAKGKVEKVVTKGQATSSEGYVLETTPDQPAFAVRIYKEQGNGWIPTDTVSVHRSDILTVITALPSPRAEDVSMIEERKSAMATAERITMSAEVRAVDTTDGSLRLAGYAATFNQEADGLNFREVIAPGAFTRALASPDPVFLLVNHDMEGIPLASSQSGTLQLRQDKNGLYIEAELDPANPKAQELTSALRRGDMDKMSFAFTVAPDGQTRDAGLRTLTQIERLFEVSVVTLPAYSSTSVGMRSGDSTDLDIQKKKLALKVKQYSLRNRKA